jgi:hypothetical protein
MISITQIAAAVVAVGTIGGGALTLDNLHVAAEDFKEYIEQQQQADEAEYVLALKQDIRELRQLLMLHPDDEYIANELQSMVDELCEFRPDDRLCEG